MGACKANTATAITASASTDMDPRDTENATKVSHVIEKHPDHEAEKTKYESSSSSLPTYYYPSNPNQSQYPTQPEPLKMNLLPLPQKLSSFLRTISITQQNQSQLYFNKQLSSV